MGGGKFIGVTGSVSIVATSGATFNLTGVKLEIGSVATPFNRQSLAKSMADCQRYYYQVFAANGGLRRLLGQIGGEASSCQCDLRKRHDAANLPALRWRQRHRLLSSNKIRRGMSSQH